MIRLVGSWLGLSRAFPLSEFATALEAKWRGDYVGGIVVTP